MPAATANRLLVPGGNTPEPHSGALQSCLLFGANCSNRATTPLKRTQHSHFLDSRNNQNWRLGARCQCSGPAAHLRSAVPRATLPLHGQQSCSDTLELGIEFAVCGWDMRPCPERSKPGNHQRSVCLRAGQVSLWTQIPWCSLPMGSLPDPEV